MRIEYAKQMATIPTSRLRVTCVYRKKIENIGKMTVMSQEELIVNTKTVVQGLEALKTEHNSILNSLQEISSHVTPTPLPLVEEKQHMVKKSLDMIELGLGEAQVNMYVACTLSMVNAIRYV